MMRALTFRSVNDLATWMNESGLGLEGILALNTNSSGWVDILYNSAVGSGSPVAYGYAAGSTTGADTAVATIGVASGAKTFTRSAGSSIADGFVVGDHVTFTGFANAGNNSTFVITTLTDTVLTAAAATGLVTEAGTADEQGVSAGHTVSVPAGALVYEVTAVGNGGAGSLTIDGGDSIPVATNGGYSTDLKGRVAGPVDIVFSGVVDYVVSWMA